MNIISELKEARDYIQAIRKFVKEKKTEISNVDFILKSYRRKQKFMFLPTRCDESNKMLWLTNVYEVECDCFFTYRNSLHGSAKLLRHFSQKEYVKLLLKL